VIAIALFYLFARISLVATDLGIIIGHNRDRPCRSWFMIMLATFKGHDWSLDAGGVNASGRGPQCGRFRLVTFARWSGNGLAVGFRDGIPAVL